MLDHIIVRFERPNLVPPAQKFGRHFSYSRVDISHTHFSISSHRSFWLVFDMAHQGSLLLELRTWLDYRLSRSLRWPEPCSNLGLTGFKVRLIQPLIGRYRNTYDSFVAEFIIRSAHSFFWKKYLLLRWRCLSRRQTQGLNYFWNLDCSPLEWQIWRLIQNHMCLYSLIYLVLSLVYYPAKHGLLLRSSLLSFWAEFTQI